MIEELINSLGILSRGECIGATVVLCKILQNDHPGYSWSAILFNSLRPYFSRVFSSSSGSICSPSRRQAGQGGRLWVISLVLRILLERIGSRSGLRRACALACYAPPRLHSRCGKCADAGSLCAAHLWTLICGGESQRAGRMHSAVHTEQMGVIQITYSAHASLDCSRWEQSYWTLWPIALNAQCCV